MIAEVIYASRGSLFAQSRKIDGTGRRLNLQSHLNIVLLSRNKSRNRATGSFSSRSYLFSSLNSESLNAQVSPHTPCPRLAEPTRAWQLQEDVAGGHPSYSPADLPHRGREISRGKPMLPPLSPHSISLVPCEGFLCIDTDTWLNTAELQRICLPNLGPCGSLPCLLVVAWEGAQPAKSQCFSTSNSSRILNAFNATSFSFWHAK